MAFPNRVWPWRREDELDVEALQERVRRLRDLLAEAAAATTWMPDDWKRRAREAQTE
jgi:hypothetical protein